MALSPRKRKHITRGHVRNRPSKYVTQGGKLRLRRPEPRRGWLQALGALLSSILRLGRQRDDQSS